MSPQQALAVIYEAIDAVNRQQPPGRRLAKSPDTIIAGPAAQLDSLGIVNLVLAIEERASDAAGVPIRLLDDTDFVNENGPLRSVASLTAALVHLGGAHKPS